MATGLSKTKWNSNVTQPSPEIDWLVNELDVWLTYEGKVSERDILETAPAQPALLWRGDEEVEVGNRLYCGDNLPVLAALLQDPSIRGKVRLVYIDPPFATRSVFQTRSQVDAYTDLLSGAHYIEFIRQGLIFLRELLAEDGSIYIHLVIWFLTVFVARAPLWT